LALLDVLLRGVSWIRYVLVGGRGRDEREIETGPGYPVW